MEDMQSIDPAAAETDDHEGAAGGGAVLASGNAERADEPRDEQAPSSSELHGGPPEHLEDNKPCAAYSYGGRSPEASTGADAGRYGKQPGHARPEPACGQHHHNIDLGKRGEDAACAFLMRHGFDIIERNWKCAAGEADIIALDESALHFVEVKTRMSEARGFPAEAVDAKKRQRYERIAELFLCTFEERFETRVTFDIISILVTGADRAFLRMHCDVFADDCV